MSGKIDRALGTHRPELRVKLSALQNQERPAPRDPKLCSGFAGVDRCSERATGELATGQPLCTKHLRGARVQGYGVVVWPKTVEEVEA